MRFESYHWHVQTVHDGNDLEALQLAIQKAKADSRPSIIKVLMAVYLFESVIKFCSHI